MPLSPETTLLLTMVAPAVGVMGIVSTRRYPNLREGVSIAAGLILIYLVSSLYFFTRCGGEVSYTSPDMLPGLALKFEIEPLGMLFLSGGLLFMAGYHSVCYRLYAGGIKKTNQTRFYACFCRGNLFGNGNRLFRKPAHSFRFLRTAYPFHLSAGDSRRDQRGENGWQGVSQYSAHDLGPVSCCWQ